MKRRKFTYIFLFLSLFSALTLFSASGGKKAPRTIDFARRVKNGDVYEVFVKLARTSEYNLIIGGSEKSLKKYEALSINFSGVLTFEEVILPEKNGDAGQGARKVTARLKIRDLSGNIQGKEVGAEHLAGKSLRVDMSKYPAVFTPLDPLTVLKKEDINLLQNIFIPPESKDTLEVFTGEKRTLKEGETFPLDTKALCRKLAARKIFCKEEDWETFCRFEGVVPFRNLNCARFTINMKMDKVSGYQFRYQATILLPEKKEDGPPVSIQRNSVEFLTRYINPANHFASGGQLSCENKENSSFIMLPLKTPEKYPGLDGGFFDLLRRK